jgi:hypothetical protein
VLDHLASFPLREEMVFTARIKPPTTMLGLGTSPLLSSSLGSSRTNNLCGYYYGGLYVLLKV